MSVSFTMSLVCLMYAIGSMARPRSTTTPGNGTSEAGRKPTEVSISVRPRLAIRGKMSLAMPAATKARTAAQAALSKLT